MSIRRLQQHEPLPEGEPRRYVTYHGYVVLRWRIGSGQYVEISEHRLVSGRPAEWLEIHHINGIKTDNRAENLQVLTRSKHAMESVTFDVDQAARAYMEGASYPELQRMFGVHQTSIMRALKRRGLTSRPSPKDKTVCVKGHPLSGSNVYRWRGHRSCRTCTRDAQKRYLQREKIIGISAERSVK